MKTFVIAEIGSVHDGSFGNAMRLIDVASECGVSAAKFQTHIASAETLRNAPMPSYFKGEPRYEYFERTGFTFEKWKTLKAHCEEKNLEFMSSPFSIEAVELLEKLGVSQYKIPSGEVTNLPMLEVVAQTGKPVLLSSGMSSWQELDRAVETILKHQSSLTVLQCTSEYPCPYDQVGLNVMLEMKERYHLPVGLSDHTLTIYASLAAVSLGASVIEKHLTFSRLMYGSDAKHSLEPGELRDMVEGIQAIEAMLSFDVNKDNIERYTEMKRIFEKSLVAVVDIPAGTQIVREMLGLKKPGSGMPPHKLNKVIGRFAAHEIHEGTLLSEDDFR